MREDIFKRTKFIFAPKLSSLGLVLLFLIGQNLLAQNLPKPIITCVDVLENGEVSINWDPIDDPSNVFAEYHIFFSINEGGPYGRIPGTNLTDRIASITYTHAGIDASAQVLYYYIIANDGLPSVSPQSNTWSTIQLKLKNESNGTVNLSWNAPLQPSPSTYTLYSRLEGDPDWNEIATNIDVENYLDTIITDSCGKEVNIEYRIESLPSGCFSSTILERGLNDVIRPEIVKINFVTVDTATGFVTIQWEKNKAKDTQGYTLFQKDKDKWITTDINGVETISYTDETVNANESELVYGLEGYDFCSGNELGILHSTVFLQTAIDVCAQEVTLSWTKDEGIDKLGRPYGWAGKIKTYEIWLQENFGAPKLLTSVDQNTKNYTHKNLVQGTNYTFVVKAIAQDNTFQSLSNKRDVSLDDIEYEGEITLNTVTVTGPSQITVIGNVDLNVPGNGFGVIRSETENGPYKLVANIPQPQANPITIIDEGVSTFERSYYYKIVAIDACGNQISSSASELGKTILLLKEDNNNETVLSFTWNEYEDWKDGIKEYEVYRNSGDQYELLETIPSTQKFFEDNLGGTGETVFSDKICYLVRAINNSPGTNDPGYSNSNMICFEFSTLEWIPNAFHVNSHVETNRTFKPVINFFDLTTYSFIIFNKWGEKVFQTTDPNMGWNGETNGKQAPQGIYVYELRYQQSNTGKSKIRKTGRVTLLR